MLQHSSCTQYNQYLLKVAMWNRHYVLASTLFYRNF